MNIRDYLILSLSCLILLSCDNGMECSSGLIDDIVNVTDTVDDTTINGYEYMDLNLPSGLKWATCNVGAESPAHHMEK